MTQEVQPLTWQKRTNIEEHQQFFSKINEIIDNLAPTVDEAEAAIAQATAAIASANDAIATANAASAAASAAATQAQTAASTVAGYDTRLTAAEGDIDALQAADQTMAGNITSLGTRMTAAESKNSQQDTAIAALQTADGQNVKINRINEYAVGLTGNQDNIAGIKKYLQPQEGAWNAHRMAFGTTIGGLWYKIGEIDDLTGTYQSQVMNFFVNSYYFNANKGGVAVFSLVIPNAGQMEGFITAAKANDAQVWANFVLKLGRRSDGVIEVFAKGRDYTGYAIINTCNLLAAESVPAYSCVRPVTAAVVPEPVADDYDQFVTVVA